MTASRNTNAADPLAREAERVRYDANHRPVDRLGISYDDYGPNAPTRQPETGADRHDPPRRGTLDPYHPDAPGEDSPKDSPARPKAPAVFQATEDGRLYVPSADKSISGQIRKPGR
jgi:hypothetical protein